MKLKMNLHLKSGIAMTVSFLLIVFLIGSIYVLPQISQMFKSKTLELLLNETKFLAKIKEYDIFFDNPPDIGYYFLISQDGITINHNDNSKIGKNLSEVLPELYNKMTKTKTGIYEYSYNGTNIFVAFAFDGENYIAHAVTKQELLEDFKTLQNKILSIVFPLIAFIIIIIGYSIVKYGAKQSQKNFNYVTSLFKQIFNNVISTSSSTAEIKSMSENTEKAIHELDDSISNFAAYLEESNAEIETTLSRIKEFTETIQSIINTSSKLNELTEILSKFTDQITDISDTITVLAINASIETSKENIDKEGVSRIAEMIMELSNNTRELAKNSKKSLSDIEKTITSNILLSEKVSKELVNVDESLKTISSVIEATGENIDKLTTISNNTHNAVEELYKGIEQIEEAINNIKEKVEEFEKAMDKIEL